MEVVGHWGIPLKGLVCPQPLPLSLMLSGHDEMNSSALQCPLCHDPLTWHGPIAMELSDRGLKLQAQINLSPFELIFSGFVTVMENDEHTTHGQMTSKHTAFTCSSPRTLNMSIPLSMRCFHVGIREACQTFHVQT